MSFIRSVLALVLMVLALLTSLENSVTKFLDPTSTNIESRVAGETSLEKNFARIRLQLLRELSTKFTPIHKIKNQWLK